MRSSSALWFVRGAATERLSTTFNRLLKSPTSGRLYNAACAVSLYAERSSDTKQLPHALELLARALDVGFPVSEATSDPDLKPLRALPEFDQVLVRARRR